MEGQPGALVSCQCAVRSDSVVCWRFLLCLVCFCVEYPYQCTLLVSGNLHGKYAADGCGTIIRLYLPGSRSEIQLTSALISFVCIIANWFFAMS